MMESLCLGRRTTSLHHQQLLLQHLRRNNHMGMALPLATAKLGGGSPVSYHHHTPMFTVFLSSILLVVSRSSRIKFWYDLALSFVLIAICVIEPVSYIYIIKTSGVTGAIAWPDFLYVIMLCMYFSYLEIHVCSHNKFMY